MTSERKLAANRRNSRKSCGPRTAAGKEIASRNAFRHGLAAITHIRPRLSKEIEGFAKALCGDDSDPLIFDQALVIAGNDLVLRSIHTQRIAVIERLRDIQAIALAKGNNSRKLAKGLIRRFDAPDFAEYWSLREKVDKQCKANPPDHIEEEEDQTIDLDLASKQIEERDEFEALEEAARDLIRLERYERRTRSRQNRAIRNFMNLKLMRAWGEAASPPPGSPKQTDESLKPHIN